MDHFTQLFRMENSQYKKKRGESNYENVCLLLCKQKRMFSWLNKRIVLKNQTRVVYSEIG